MWHLIHLTGQNLKILSGKIIKEKVANHDKSEYWASDWYYQLLLSINLIDKSEEDSLKCNLFIYIWFENLKKE